MPQSPPVRVLAVDVDVAAAAAPGRLPAGIAGVVGLVCPNDDVVLTDVANAPSPPARVRGCRPCQHAQPALVSKVSLPLLEGFPWLPILHGDVKDRALL